MVQMVGVVILALGLSQMFDSIEHGATLHFGVMVAGYVVMRVSLVFLWWGVSRHDPEHRYAAYTYLGIVAVTQVGWVLLAISHLSVRAPSSTTCIRSSPSSASSHESNSPRWQRAAPDPLSRAQLD
jgi:hypothetical protein